MGIISGVLTLPTYSLAYFIGAIFGKLILERKMGVRKWNEVKPLISAGLAMGVGISVGITAPIAVIFKAMWSRPY
jgi:hypothetical protein